MTMISPEDYAQDIKNLSYEELVVARNNLITALHQFELEYNPNEIGERDNYTDVIYQMDNLYLVEVTKLLNGKYNKMV